MSITLDGVVRFVHLLSASVWVGGMVAMTSVLPGMLAAGFHGSEVRGVARRFSTITFPAMVIAAATGIWKITGGGTEVTTTITAKLALTTFAVLLALWHARASGLRTPARALTFIRGLLLLTGIALIAASVWI